MNLQYGGTKKTIEKDRETALRGVEGNKAEEKKADAVNALVDAFLKDKAIHDNTRVNVTAVSSERALTVNITLDQDTFIPPPNPEAPTGKALTKAQERDKQAANAKSVIKKVERIKAPKEAK
jgi:hypothetical protein